MSIYEACVWAHSNMYVGERALEERKDKSKNKLFFSLSFA